MTRAALALDVNKGVRVAYADGNQISALVCVVVNDTTVGAVNGRRHRESGSLPTLRADSSANPPGTTGAVVPPIAIHPHPGVATDSATAAPAINPEPEAGYPTPRLIPCGPMASARSPTRPLVPEHAMSTQPSTMDMEMALILGKPPGQSLDHGCAVTDSNPEPAD